jgi:hypothetical protein
LKHPLGIGIGDAGISESLRVIAALAPFSEPPVRGNVDDDPLDDLSRWVTALESVKRDGSAKWFHGSVESYKDTKLVAVSRASSRVTFDLPEGFATVDEALRWIEVLPFEVCSLGTIFPDEWLKLDVDTFGFGRGHYAHGWGCAFRGAGHNRLVSRRWLEFGPWRILRRSADLTLVQFHDLNADAATAAGQARPGHERMGISKIGGYLQVPYAYTRDVEGLYVAERRTLEIVVPPGGKVEQVHMRDACALRYEHRVLQPAEKPIDQLAYIFLDESDAHAHLHELWLRELEVWLVDGAGKRRLDATYCPTPILPEWVTSLE